MRTRRFAMLLSLLTTAALLYALPGLLSTLNAADRARDDLRPRRARTLKVWLLSDDVNDAQALRELISAFERERDGVRVFLRRVDAGELQAPQTVLPDVALYGIGALMEPQKVFLPIADLAGGAHSAGMYGGQCYAAPLWYEPNVLCAPRSWTHSQATPSRASDSFFDVATAPPDAGDTRLLSGAELPWRRLLAPGALQAPSGVAWQQLLATCPAALRAELLQAMRTGGEAAGEDARAESGEATKPAARASAALGEQARILPLSACLRAEGVLLHPLAPVASNRVRFVSLCRDGEDARAFASYLLSSGDAALAYGLMPLVPPAEVADPLRAALVELCRAGALLPNAFAHAPQELNALCEDAFDRAEDPATTLLKLR